MSDTTNVVAALSDLPYDVLHDIFKLLPAQDLVQFLCCCRKLYTLAEQESIWQSLSALYALHDISHFAGRSWFTIYTRLLRPYGPMLGLWAGDHPYTGSVLDVRLHPGDSTIQGGIIIGLWQFRILQPEELDGPEWPEPPISIPLARIDFSKTPTIHQHPRVICCCARRSTIPPHSATLQLFSSTDQSLSVHTRHGQHPHPDFPSLRSFEWVDESRYPHLPIYDSEVVDQTPEMLPQRPRIPIIFSVPSGYRKPPAICISCHHGCIERNRPFLSFDNRTPFPPRYYPLRLNVPIGTTSAEWSPQSLVGLWLGSHGPHGTEALYLQWGESSTLGAWKITGDENVPRGTISWEVNMGSTVVIPHPPAWTCAIGELMRFRLFEGTGTISARGFFSHQKNITRIVLAVPLEDPDTLRVGWMDMEEVSGYMRYRSRVEV